MTKKTEKNPLDAAAKVLVTAVRNALNEVDSHRIIDAFASAQCLNCEKPILEDPDTVIDEELATEAKEWIIEMFIGSLCYNVENGRLKGSEYLNKATDSTMNALARDASNPNQDSQKAVAKAMRWEARQHLQADFRKAITPLAHKAFELATGKKYVFGKATAKPVDGGNIAERAQALELLRKVREA